MFSKLQINQPNAGLLTRFFQQIPYTVWAWAIVLVPVHHVQSILVEGLTQLLFYNTRSAKCSPGRHSVYLHSGEGGGTMSSHKIRSNTPIFVQTLILIPAMCVFPCPPNLTITPIGTHQQVLESLGHHVNGSQKHPFS